MRRSVAFVGLLGCTWLAGVGCGGAEDFDLASVRGKVTCNGQPVNGGEIHFDPAPENPDANQTIVGRPASGIITEDGTFVLTTYESGDGAVLGRHRVTISAPEATGEAGVSSEEPVDNDAPEAQNDDRLPAPKLACTPPGELIVQVREGDNVIQIELADGTVKREE